MGKLNWRVTGYPDFADVRPMEGSGDGPLKVTLHPVEMGVSNTGTISIECEGHVENIHVTTCNLHDCDCGMSINPMHVEFDAKDIHASSVLVKFNQCVTGFSYTMSDFIRKISDSRPDGETAIVSFMASENTSTEPRNGFIKFKTKGSGCEEEQEISVTQAGKEYICNGYLTPTSASLDAEGVERAFITITKPDGYEGLCGISDQIGDFFYAIVDDTAIRLAAFRNPSTEPRTGSFRVQFLAMDNCKTDEFTVTQAGQEN